MDGNQILSLIVQKDWELLLNNLKDNNNISKLFDDPIFLYTFNLYFVDELIKADDIENDDYILILTSIRVFHSSSSHKFKLLDGDYKKVILKLFDLTKDIDLARLFPEEECCRVFIEEHNKNEDFQIKSIKDDHRLSQTFDINQHESVSNEPFAISIFKSPQEKDVYDAASVVFKDYTLLPNAALSTLINNKVLSRLTKKEGWYFLSTTVDLVIVDNKTSLPIHFIEIDSSFHDEPEQKLKDKLKNKLITEAGFKLIRIRQKKNDATIDDYIIFLNREKVRTCTQEESS